jgi:hypothetical protein
MVRQVAHLHVQVVGGSNLGPANLNFIFHAFSQSLHSVSRIAPQIRESSLLFQIIVHYSLDIMYCDLLTVSLN